MDKELQAAKEGLDRLIAKSRVDLYKPIQIAEVLYRRRMAEGAERFDIADVEAYRLPSRTWRDEVTLRLLGKCSTSSARYQDDIWNDTAMPPRLLESLDRHNRGHSGVCEAYIYRRFARRQSLVSGLIADLKVATPSAFDLSRFLDKFDAEPGLRRSVDKAYEIVAFAILDLLVRKVGAQVRLDVPVEGRPLLEEFSDLGKAILGVSAGTPFQSSRARIYRVGVTNAADRGLDMWANFGPAIQVKHLNLDVDLAEKIVKQLDADRVVVVCCEADSVVIKSVLDRLGIGGRIAGIIQQRDLIQWYEQALRGRFSGELGAELLGSLLRCFESEFPQATDATAEFIAERGYDRIQLDPDWCD